MRAPLPRRRQTPRRTLAHVSANSLSAAVQGQFMFVLPWMLLARGSSPQTAALATAFVYVPMLATAVPAGAKSDKADPLRLMRWVTAAPLAACALYPLASRAGRDWFGLVLLAAVVVGVTRNLSEGAVFRSLADTTPDEGLLRAHAIRTTVNRAALFGTGFIGLILFRLGGADAVLVGICALYAAALAILAIVPELDRAPDPDVLVRELVADGLSSGRRNRLLRRIGWVTLTHAPALLVAPPLYCAFLLSNSAAAATSAAPARPRSRTNTRECSTWWSAPWGWSASSSASSWSPACSGRSGSASSSR